MNEVQNLFRSTPRRYRKYPCLIILIGLLICLIYLHRRPSESKVEVLTDDTDVFDLYDDDDTRLICPLGIQFNISNRRHLAVILAPKLVPFVWRSFYTLLCTGVDVYVMFDEVFLINSSTRVDTNKTSTNQSIRSYTDRFLYISNEELENYGVTYMTKYPRVPYTSLERAIVWLYNHNDLKTVWVINHPVQWLDPQNMTHLFNKFASDHTDILCTDIVPTNSPYWQQWPQTESDIFPRSYWVGTYSPLVRWSRNLLLHHYQYMQLIHADRLQYEISRDFRFVEFIMPTIANIEKLSIGIYSKKYRYMEIALDNKNDTEILSLLQRGKYIIHPIKQDSILTKYLPEEIAEMIKQNRIDFQSNTTLL